VKTLVPFGTRPEIVKLAPVVRALRARGLDVQTVATGQHYDANLTDTFFDELGLRPDVRWELPAGEHERVGALLASAFEHVDRTRPDLVLVLGDTYTVPVFGLAARRHGVPVAHVEAGLRSFNETSIEEVNRRLVMVTASLHFAPTDLAARFLADEGVDPARVHVVGNPAMDVLRELDLRPCPVAARDGVVVTVHRPTNVDDPERLDALVRLVRELASLGPVRFPMHPRTRERLERAGRLTDLSAPGVEVTPPVPYREMVGLVASARVVVTDSGGLQEEAAWLGVPVVVLRRSTPRWEGMAAGTSALTGLEVDAAMDAAARFVTRTEQRRVAETPCPYGDGHTSERIAALLDDPEVRSRLALVEHDFVGRPPPS
jgi:UDP-N-acetylglucosamine 2-epimerase (non-hydrolysing)